MGGAGLTRAETRVSESPHRRNDFHVTGSPGPGQSITMRSELSASLSSSDGCKILRCSSGGHWPGFQVGRRGGSQGPRSSVTLKIHRKVQRPGRPCNPASWNGPHRGQGRRRPATPKWPLLVSATPTISTLPKGGPSSAIHLGSPGSQRPSLLQICSGNF